MTDLAALAAVVPGACLLAAPVGPGPEITGLAYDSRRVQPGDLFFCIRGLKADGLQFLPDAVARGAVAAVVDEALDSDQRPSALPVPALMVPDARAAMAPISAAFYGYPSRRLKLVGVTGTNGKTTT